MFLLISGSVLVLRALVLKYLSLSRVNKKTDHENKLRLASTEVISRKVAI